MKGNNSYSSLPRIQDNPDQSTVNNYDPNRLGNSSHHPRYLPHLNGSQYQQVQYRANNMYRFHASQNLESQRASYYTADYQQQVEFFGQNKYQRFDPAPNPVPQNAYIQQQVPGSSQYGYYRQPYFLHPQYKHSFDSGVPQHAPNSKMQLQTAFPMNTLRNDHFENGVVQYIPVNQQIVKNSLNVESNRSPFPISNYNRFPENSVSQFNGSTKNNDFLPIKHLQNVANKIPKQLIEKTEPVLKKHKKIVNIGEVDYLKILMSLKSGLLAETTWAFDVLNIHSHNGSFRLCRSPSTLDNLIDYFKCYLNALFGDILVDTQNDFQYELVKELDNDENLAFEHVEPSTVLDSDRVKLLDCVDNYTFKSRHGKPVKILHEVNSGNLAQLSSYDSKSVLNRSDLEETCDHLYFEEGNGLTTSHIIKAMDSEDEYFPFLAPKHKSEQNIQEKLNVTGTKRKLELDNESEECNLKNIVLCSRRDIVDNMIRRCHCISAIIRNLSFSPDNLEFMSNSRSLIMVLARLLLLNHRHFYQKDFLTIIYEKEHKVPGDEETESREICQDNLNELVHLLRVNTLVTLANLSENLDLSNFSDKIILSLMDGLLHWATCLSSYAQDCHPPDDVSLQLLSLEILGKLSINVSNIDLLLATPPFSRVEDFYRVLVKSIGKDNDQVLRELSLVILSNFAFADVLSARIILHIDHVVSNLVTFIEQYEHSKRQQHYQLPASKNYMWEPFTIAYMLKHAARTLRNLGSVCERGEIHILKKMEDKIVDLAMSNVLEPDVVSILADLVYILSHSSENKVSHN